MSILGGGGFRNGHIVDLHGEQKHMFRFPLEIVPPEVAVGFPLDAGHVLCTNDRRQTDSARARCKQEETKRTSQIKLPTKEPFL